MTYSNLINNNRTLSNFDFSADEKMTDEILINIFNKIFLFLNKEKSNKIILLDSFYKKQMNYFPKKIYKILNSMIEILCKNISKKKKNSVSNNSISNSTKNSLDNLFVIDKNNFINEMLYNYKYYLNNEHKKILLSYKNNIDKIIQDNIFLDNSFGHKPKSNSIKNDFISPKSYQKKTQFRNKTEFKNNKIKEDYS